MSNIISFDLALAREISEGRAPGKILTRDGYSVKIIYWNAIGSFPIVGLVNYGSYERAEHYTVDGLSNFGHNRKSDYDLIIVQG
jgi:hypothetical protein